MTKGTSTPKITNVIHVRPHFYVYLDYQQEAAAGYLYSSSTLTHRRDSSAIIAIHITTTT